MLTARLYGALETDPSDVEPLKNSTLVTEPSSDAVACRTPVQGSEKVALLGGFVIVTLGG